MRKTNKRVSIRSQHRKGLRRAKRARVHRQRLESIERMPMNQRAGREIAIRVRMGMKLGNSITLPAL
jgi:hypothetical protein